MSFQCSLYGVCPAAMQPRLVERLRGLCQPIQEDATRFITKEDKEEQEQNLHDVDFRTSCLRFESSSGSSAVISVRVQWPSAIGNPPSKNHHGKASESENVIAAACVLSHCGPAEPPARALGVSVRPVLAVPVWCPSPARKIHGKNDADRNDPDVENHCAMEVERFVRALIPSASPSAACRRWQYRQRGRAFIYRDQYRVLVTRLIPEGGENAMVPNNADGDANGGPSREQEMMMLYNAQVMGTMAATDINVPDVVMADAAADGLFMA